MAGRDRSDDPGRRGRRFAGKSSGGAGGERASRGKRRGAGGRRARSGQQDQAGPERSRASGRRPRPGEDEGRGSGRPSKGGSASTRAAGDRTPTERLPKPQLPDQRPRLPRDVFADLKAAARPGTLDDVSAAFAAAGSALEDGKVSEAIEYLTWAKSVAARSAVIREALGVAHYLNGDFAAARSELQSYRRLANRADQNHLLADCARAEGRSDKVAEYVEEMLSRDVPPDRVAEGLIVLAGDRADHGDVDGALVALRRAPMHKLAGTPAQLRVWYMEAGLHARKGDHQREQELLARIAAVDPDFVDSIERPT